MIEKLLPPLMGKGRSRSFPITAVPGAALNAADRLRRSDRESNGCTRGAALGGRDETCDTQSDSGIERYSLLAYRCLVPAPRPPGSRAARAIFTRKNRDFHFREWPGSSAMTV